MTSHEQSNNKKSFLNKSKLSPLIKSRPELTMGRIVLWSSTFALLLSSIILFFVSPELSIPFLHRSFNIYRVLVMFGAMILLILSSKSFWCNQQSTKAQSNSSGKYGLIIKMAALIVPIAIILVMILQLVNPELAAKLIRKETWPFYRLGIFVKSFLQITSAVLFVLIAIRYKKSKNLLGFIASCLIAIVLIIMAGEELSWGQRIFGWATPEFFLANNQQYETNLHNLATQNFQNILYFGTWLLLIAFSFWGNALSRFIGYFKPLKFLQDWLPPEIFILIFGAAFAIADPLRSDTGIYFGSNLFIIIGTFCILTTLIIKSIRSSNYRKWLHPVIILLIFIFTALTSLKFSMLREYNVGAPTEYLEAFINLGIILWATTAYYRVKQMNTSNSKKTI